MTSIARGNAQSSVVLRIVVAAALGACSADRPPAPPAATDSVNRSVMPPPPRTLSRFDVPLDYDFTPILGIVERVVPRAFGSLDSVRAVEGDGRKHYSFAATREGFKAFAAGHELHLRTTISYQARLFYKPPMSPTLGAGCGNEREQPRIVVELVTPLTLQPNWRLQSAARIAMLEPASTTPRDRCTVSIFSYDVTQRVIDAARNALTSRLDDIDQTIADVDLTSRVQEWWRLLNNPIRLTDGVWLLLHPTQLRLGEMTGSAHTLTVRAGLDAFPSIVTGAPPHPSLPRLPPLAHYTKGGGFQISVEGNVDYLTASEALTKALQGRLVVEAGRTVLVQSAVASADSAGRIALALGFTGDATGTLRLVGTPRYSPAIGMIDVPDLAYDLKTDKNVINAYAWLRSDVLLATLRARARVPAAPVLDRGRSLLVDGLNRTIGGVMTIKATVDSVAVGGLYVTPTGLLVRARAIGKARVAVRQNP